MKRSQALIALIPALLGFVTGLGVFVFLPRGTEDAMRQSARMLTGAGGFWLLCDLVAIVLGARAIRREPRKPTLAVVAIVVAGIGVLGAALLIALGALLKDCASWQGTSFGKVY